MATSFGMKTVPLWGLKKANIAHRHGMFQRNGASKNNFPSRRKNEVEY